MNKDNALTVVSSVASPTEATLPTSIGEIANNVAKQTVLLDYQVRRSAQTLRRQKADVALFERFLSGEGHQAEGLVYDLTGWSVASWGLVEKFCRWQVHEGYALSTINIRLSTIKVYCQLAAKAEYLSVQECALIQSVKGYSGKDAGQVDKKRVNDAIPTRKSSKKAQPTTLKPEHVELLKQQPATPEGYRDRLIICLLFDHALRCGEVALLDVTDIELDPALKSGLLHITSEKTRGPNSKKQKARLTPDTYDAASAYLACFSTLQGPLFAGKISKERINERSLYHRVKLLGRRIGLKLGISPHDGRHFYVDDALEPENENSLADIQKGVRHSTPAMVLRYATEKQITNEHVMLTSMRKRKGTTP